MTCKKYTFCLDINIKIESVLKYSSLEMGWDEYLNCGLQHGMKDEPWHVTLSRKGSVDCSGVIINSHWVLTTADCVLSTETGV